MEEWKSSVEVKVVLLLGRAAGLQGSERAEGERAEKRGNWRPFQGVEK